MLINDWLPPRIYRWIRTYRGKTVDFHGNFASWDAAKTQTSGYASLEILSKVRTAALKAKYGEACFERDSLAFYKPEYVWPLLSGLMLAAAKNNGKLNVLDFGGSLGSSYFQHKYFLDRLPSIRWNIVEQAHYVEAGRAEFEDSTLRFYSSISECSQDTVPNVIIVSSTIQYLQHPYETIRELSEIGSPLLIIDRTPFSAIDKDRIIIQTVPKSIYRASYPMWIISLPKFMEFIDYRWNLVASNTSPEGTVAMTDGTEFTFRGMLLEAR